jgi:hypothetical protein
MANLRTAIMDAVPQGGPGLELALFAEVLAEPQQGAHARAREVLEAVAWALISREPDAWARVERAYLAVLGAQERRLRCLEYVGRAIAEWHDDERSRRVICDVLRGYLVSYVDPAFRALDVEFIESVLASTKSDALVTEGGRGKRGPVAVAVKLSERVGAFAHDEGGAERTAFQGVLTELKKALLGIVTVSRTLVFQ